MHRSALALLASNAGNGRRELGVPERREGGRPDGRVGAGKCLEGGDARLVRGLRGQLGGANGFSITPSWPISDNMSW
jgi:hypothetical protein